MTHAESEPNKMNPDPIRVPGLMCVPPGGTIGMLGGGQLGRMFAIAAAQLGYRVIVFSDSLDCPAATVAYQTIVGELTDRDRIDEFAAQCDVVTLEFENLPVEAVRHLASRVTVYPTPEVLRIAQDRRYEKQAFADAGLAVTPFHVVESSADLRAAVARLGLPLVLKTARDGYDGKGQWKITSPGDAALAMTIDRPMIAEAWITHRREVSVIVARDASGHTACFPVFENVHRNHILDVTTCPANLSIDENDAAIRMATAAAAAIDLVGLMCVEMFQGENGDLMINEVAPRPHNSGHLTIEACVTSQFEQHVRVVCGMPLGDTTMRVPAAAMVNLMGELWAGGEPDFGVVMAKPGMHLHLYDKGRAATGRKMGHVTATGGDAAAIATELVATRDSMQTARERQLA